MSLQLLQATQAHLGKLIAAGVPFPLRFSFWTLLLLNAPSFPGVWHLFTVWPWFIYGVQNALGKKRVNHRVGLDAFAYRESRTFRATPDKCDAFGFHLSNASYGECADHLRGPGTVLLVGTYFELPGATFALGATSYKFMKEVPFLGKFTTTQQLVGYDKKWLYTLQSFTSPSGTLYCTLLSHIVLKINRRTVPPARALALAGYGGARGVKNAEIIKGMTKKEQIAWLFEAPGEEGKDWGIDAGPVEVGMEKKGEWPGAL